MPANSASSYEYVSQGEGVCTEREVLDEEEITERAGGVFGMMTTRVGA